MILQRDKVKKNPFQIIQNVDELVEMKKKSILITLDLWEAQKN